MADITKKEETALSQTGTPLGFEDEDPDDLIIPRLKLMQALSPEVDAGQAEVGHIINSLTGDDVTDKVFVPVCKFNNNVLWRPREDGGGIICRARDGRTGENEDGTTMACSQCRKCEFDNSKSGRDAAPSCIKYINFMGFFDTDPTPIILSFSKTNMTQGRKMYSMAKVTGQNIWNFGYRLTTKKMSKNGNSWYVIEPVQEGATSEEQRNLGFQIYNTYAATIGGIEFDLGENEAKQPEKTVESSDTEVEF